MVSLVCMAPTASASMVYVSLEGMSPEEREVVLASQVGQRVQVTLADGATAVGDLIAAVPWGLFVAEDGAVAAQDYALDRVVSVTRYTTRTLDVPGRSPSGGYLGLQTVMLLDGRSLAGVVVALTPTLLTLGRPGGDRLGVPRERIAGITAGGHHSSPRQSAVQRAEAQPTTEEVHSASRYHRARHFVLRSAKPLGKWEGSVSQKELGYSEFSMGVSDHFSIYAGAVLPAWVIGGDDGLHFVLGTQGGLEVAQDLYWSGSLHAALLPEDLLGAQSVIGALNFGATLTWGPDDLHASLGLLVPVLFAADLLEVELIVSLAASVEVADWLALMTEHSFSPTLIVDGGPESFHMAGFRVMFRDWSFDIAAVYFPLIAENIPLVPWLDVTYRWGTPATSDAAPLDDDEGS